MLKNLAPVLGTLLASAALAAPPVPYATVFVPGTSAELPFMVKTSGAMAAEGLRQADIGQFWVYGFAAAAGARCRLGLTLTADAAAPLPNISVTDGKGKPIPFRTERDSDGTLSIFWTVPDKWPLGERLPIVISAKEGPVGVRLVRFAQIEADSDRNGIPDSVQTLLREGIAPAVSMTIAPVPDRPFTITQTPLVPTQNIDLQTDAVFVYGTDVAAIAGWKARGYTVWTMGGARDGKEYAQKFPGEVQTDAAGRPISILDSYYLSPSPNRLAIEKGYYEQALNAGSDGICPEEPEYWARAGYEQTFREAWLKTYNTPWRDPAANVENRWKAGRLMAMLETNHVATMVDFAAQKKPAARRLVALHSPISYAQWGVVCPQYQITSLANVQEVIGQVWTGTARTPARYAGIRQDRTFALAYLEYSSLYHLLRGTNKRLWFLMDPLEDNPNLPIDDYKRHYEETLVASLLFPGVSAYQVMPWPERVYGKIPAPYATQIGSVIAALQDMNTQNSSGVPYQNGIGVFVSDAMQWQREAPNASDFDGVFGLTLPLLQRGIPVQTLSLDRAADPNYLKPFKTLLLSYDFQKPLDSRTHTALNSWVRQGGSLLFFGGSDAYNGVVDSWWWREQHKTPQDDLWAKLGLKIDGLQTTKRAAQEETYRYTSLLKGDGSEKSLKNRRAYTFDLSRFVGPTGSVAVRFSDVSPADGWGAYVAAAELRIGGKLAASFRTGSDIESRFLVFDNASQFNNGARFADGSASWTYQFDGLPKDLPIVLTVDMGNGFAVDAASAQPEFGHTLLSGADSGELGKQFPRLRIGAAYPVTLTPLADLPADSKNGKSPNTIARPAANVPGREPENETDVLFNLRSGGAPVWAKTVGKGLVVHVGVAPGFFSASERSASLLRALTQYAQQRAGATYREPGSLRVQRGKYTVVRTLSQPVRLPGATIDLLSPSLSVSVNRVVPPRSYALVCAVPTAKRPTVAFVSGRLLAKIETEKTTSFFVRGPAGTNGVARITTDGKNLAAFRATDRLGRPLGVQSFPDNGSVLVQFPHDPDGIVIRLGWD